MEMTDAEEYLRNYTGDHLAVEPELGEVLHDLIVKEKPDLVVEVGTGNGYSSCWMLLALEKNKKGRLMTIDVAPPELYLWDKMNLPTRRLEIMPGTLEENLQFIPDNVGLAFLDSDHQIHNIVKDVELLTPKIVPGGKMVVHDVNYCRDMGDLLRKYFELGDGAGLKHCGVDLPKESKWKDYEEITKFSGLGIVTKKGEGK